MNKRTVDMARLARVVLEELNSQDSSCRVEIKVGGLPECYGDAALLKQVWMNLLSNAVKYSRGRSHAVVEVGCTRESGQNVYFVGDNGAGFDMTYAHKLFGVFQRLHNSDEFEGTGVGLAIVQRVVFRHGGRVWAKAEVGRGVTFFSLLQKKANSMSDSGENEILLVEDNSDDFEMTLRALRKANIANHVKVARDGAEALEFIFGEGIQSELRVEEMPKLILLDLKL